MLHNVGASDCVINMQYAIRAKNEEGLRRRSKKAELVPAFLAARSFATPGLLCSQLATNLEKKETACSLVQ